jgi:hypothetical protein
MNSKSFFITRIPNRLVIQPFPFLILAPILIVSILFTKTDSTRQLDSLQLLMVSTLSYGIFCLVLLLYKQLYIVPRIESDSPIFSIALVALIAGLVKGSFTNVCFKVLSDFPNADINGFARVISAAIISTIGVTGFTYLNYEIHRLRKIRHSRISALTESESRRMTTDVAMNTLVNASQVDIEEGIRATLTEVLDSLDDVSIDGPELDLALSKLASASSHQLQSLTMQLQKKLELEFPRLTWITLIKTVLALRFFPVISLTVLIIIFTSGFIFQNDSADLPLMRIAVIGLCSFLSLKLGNFCMSRVNRFSAATWISTVTLCAVSPYIVGIAFFGDSFNEVVNNFFAYIVSLFVLAAIACLTNGFIFQKRNIEIALLDSLDISRVREQASVEINRRLLKEMIDFLHGRVQSRLMASAMAISGAKNSNDHDKLELELITLRTLAEAPFEKFETYRTLSLDTAIENLIQTWQGLLEITIDQVTLEILKDLDAFKISSIIEEALLNAFRHGHALKIEVAAEKNNSQIVLLITDDGAGPMLGAANLGSALFDSVAISWLLSSGSDGIGAELKLTLT